MWFQIIGPIRDVELIAEGRSLRDLKRLRKVYGGRRWRKLKGVARAELSGGWVGPAEVHWYEAHGIGRRELKIKRVLG